MDSSGMALMLDQARSFAAGLHVACEPRGPISRLLAMAQLEDVLPCHGNRTEALDAASRSART